MATIAQRYLEAEQGDDLDELIEAASLGIMYSGFSPARTREEMFDKKVTLKDLVILLTALAITGNNPERLSNAAKITDLTVGQAVAAVARKYGIFGTKKKTNATVTLARLGAAFMPVYMYVRMRLAQTDKLQDQFPNTIHPLLQDPMLGGLAEQRGQIESYRKYYDAFTAALAPTRPSTPATNTTDWVGIQVQGFKRDKAVSEYFARVSDEGQLGDINNVRRWFSMVQDAHARSEQAGTLAGASIPTGTDEKTTPPPSGTTAASAPTPAPAAAKPKPASAKPSPEPK